MEKSRRSPRGGETTLSVPRSASDERLGCGPGSKAKDMELWAVLTSPLVLAVAVGIALVIACLYYSRGGYRIL